MIDVLLDHHCNHPEDSIQLMLRKYMQDLVGSSNLPPPPYQTPKIEIRAPRQNAAQHTTRNSQRPPSSSQQSTTSTAWGDLANDSPHYAKKNEWNPAEAAEHQLDGWTNAAVLSSAPPSAVQVTSGWLASQSSDLPSVEDVPISWPGSATAEDYTGDGSERKKRQNKKKEEKQPRSRRPSTKAAASPSPATPVEPVDVHAVRGKLMLRVNVPVPKENDDSAPEQRMLAIYEVKSS